MLRLDPAQRLTTAGILHHSFFEGVDQLLPLAVQKHTKDYLDKKHDHNRSVRITEQPCISIGSRRCRIKLTEEDIKCLQKMVLTHGNFLKKGSKSKSKSKPRAPSTLHRSPDHFRSPLQNVKNKLIKAGSRTPDPLDKYHSKTKSSMALHRPEQTPSHDSSSPIGLKARSPVQRGRLVAGKASNRPTSSYRPEEPVSQRILQLRQLH